MSSARWALALTAVVCPPLLAQGPMTLEKRLQAEAPAALVRDALKSGDATRGAILFHQHYLACTQCHQPGAGDGPLGPELARKDRGSTPEQAVESVLRPSKTIRKGYEPFTVLTVKGAAYTGLLVKRTPAGVVLRIPEEKGKEITIAAGDIEKAEAGKVSIMPAGQANQLASRQQFLDLLRYLLEIREGGPRKARELEPPAVLVAAPPLPEYENDIDHAGMIRSLDGAAFRRGEAIYARVCANCHGTLDKPGSLPTSLRFAEGKFKNGGGPHTMYQTLTRGFGLMQAQAWMVPRQKYDVIHYVREEYLKKRNPSQYFRVTEEYLAGLPAGKQRGPAPASLEPWASMDYGHTLINTYEVPGAGSNFAYKGIAVRLDAGPGGVSRGGAWVVFDHDTLRLAAAWAGKGFIDYNGIHFNGQHAVHPRLVGQVHIANPGLPGWGKPGDGSFDAPRVVGRDGKKYGPLPRPWAHYKGLYHHGHRAIISYTVGKTDVLEMPGLVQEKAGPLFTRTFQIGPREHDMVLQVAHDAASGGKLSLPRAGVAVLGDGAAKAPAALRFDGATQVALAKPEGLDMHGADYAIHARIRTSKGGTIFARAPASGPWAPDGVTFFVRHGKLCLDVGWVGAVTSRQPVADGKWHDVALAWESKTGRARLHVDGKLAGEGTIRPKAKASKFAARIGYTSPNFPSPQSFFDGEIAELGFYSRALAPSEAAGPDAKKALVARWLPASSKGGVLRDETGHGHDGAVALAPSAPQGRVVAGLSVPVPGSKWHATKEGHLRLTIPAGKDALSFSLWMGRVKEGAEWPSPALEKVDLKALTRGGPRRWLDTVQTKGTRGSDDGPFAVDDLPRPASNPWLCQVRLSGFDFYPDGKRAVVCAWDGDVWLVSGIDRPERGLVWRRIASGLFQPLGVKLVDGKPYVSCRDQIVVLHDLNGDGEIDFYENFNNDHQVTEHFHEFAMGLQRDGAGNFYYAKSARHALPALVPHHGTLLKVAKDGSRTEIIARGFRAANGVCLSPDGTFFVTDQEGHWTPKNRINWVKKGGFYGNMMAYHGVKDESNSAMEQPLCWITNAFDRSPAEPLWVDGKGWGPLRGALLNLSYGYGQIYTVPHEKVGGQIQGGVCPLPLPPLPTGIMRGRFSPADGQLYVCGLYAWAGNRQQPGGFYRIRHTGKPTHAVLGLSARKKELRITFSDKLDARSTRSVDNVLVKAWSLKRTKSYGSGHHDEKPLAVRRLRLSADKKTLVVEVPDLAPTWCMEIKYALVGEGGGVVKGAIHNTIHRLGE